MIRQLYRVLGPEGSRPLNRLLVLQCAAAVLQGWPSPSWCPSCVPCSAPLPTTCGPG